MFVNEYSDEEGNIENVRRSERSEQRQRRP